jgi:hypothetical protein
MVLSLNAKSTGEEETVHRKPATGEFGADWPREKLMCYWVRFHVLNTLGSLERLQEVKGNESESEKAVQSALAQNKAAMTAVEELFQMLCRKEFQ